MTRTAAFCATLAALGLGGCAGLAGAGAGVAVATAPTIVQTISAGATVLDDTAQLACATQAFANDIKNVKLSYYAGLLCKW